MKIGSIQPLKKVAKPIVPCLHVGEIRQSFQFRCLWANVAERSLKKRRRLSHCNTTSISFTFLIKCWYLCKGCSDKHPQSSLFLFLPVWFGVQLVGNRVVAISKSRSFLPYHFSILEQILRSATSELTSNILTDDKISQHVYLDWKLCKCHRLDDRSTPVSERSSQQSRMCCLVEPHDFCHDTFIHPIRQS
jgi:hypothetical protein